MNLDFFQPHGSGAIPGLGGAHTIITPCTSVTHDNGVDFMPLIGEASESTPAGDFQIVGVGADGEDGGGGGSFRRGGNPVPQQRNNEGKTCC